MKRQNKTDVVYFVKESLSNDELKYSLRTVEKNWPCRKVVFCGGRPNDLIPDKMFRIRQQGLNKWEKVRNSIQAVCKNENISEDFWLFNDDFFIMKPYRQNFKPQYNGSLAEYIESIRATRNGLHSQYTIRLLGTIRVLEEAGCTTLNYETHKPMLINRKKALEVLERFADIPGFRSLYGNYWEVGGLDNFDCKVKDLFWDDWSDWKLLSTTDVSFREGEVGKYIREKFNKISRFEKQ